MPPDELSGPDLAGVVADAEAVGLGYVVLRGGVPPLDYKTVAERAETIEFLGQTVRVASLASVVGLKRLANRLDPDRSDLRHLEAIHGPLPIEPIPGLDDMGPTTDDLVD